MTVRRFRSNERVAQRAVVLLELTLVEDRVDRHQHVGRRGALGHRAPSERAATDQLAGEHAVERGRHTLSGDVAQRHDDGRGVRQQKIVEIAAELARGRERRRHIDAFHPLGQLRRQQCRLDALGEAQFAVDASLVGRDRLVHAGVLDRDGGLAREHREDLDVALRERVELGALDIEHADAAILDEHRHDQLRPDVLDHLDVAWVLRDIGREHRLRNEARRSRPDPRPS